MKRKILILIFALILTGCSSNTETIEISKHNREINMLKITYESKIQDLKDSYKKQLKNLNVNTKSKSNDEVLQVNEEKIALMEKDIEQLEEKLENYDLEYSKVKKNYDLVNRILFDKIDDTSLYDDIYIDNKIVKLYSEGTEELEDGIICVLEVLDINENIIWQVKWEELQVSELATYSPVAISEDKIYIVITGKLNVLNLNTGEILWEPVIVGSSSSPPIIDEEGYIYAVGQYGPFLTAVSKEGIIEWQVEREDLYLPCDIAVFNEYILVNWIDGIAVFDKEGNMII